MRHAFIILAATLAFSAQALAQSLPFLNLQSSPEAVALAGATVARAADGFALESNAAAMAQDSAKFAAGLSYGSWKPGSSIVGGAFHTRLGERSALGADIKYFGGKAYEGMDENGAPLERYRPVDISCAVGFAYAISEKLSAAATAFFANSGLAPENSASAFGANLALRYTDGAFSAGLSIDHLGSKVDYGYGPYSLPSMVKAGAAYSINGFTAMAEADYLFEGSFMAAVAVEYEVRGVASFRAGYHYGAQNAPSIPSYLSAGTGLNLGPVTINAAFLLLNESLKGSALVGLGLQF